MDPISHGYMLHLHLNLNYFILGTQQMGVYVCIQPPLSTLVNFCSLPWTKLNSCQIQLEWQTNTWRDISLIFYDLFKFVLKKNQIFFIYVFVSIKPSTQIK